MKKRIFSLFLATAFVLLCLLASGCEEATDATSSVGADASGESAEESTGGRFFGLDIPEDIDFGGKTVRVLTTSTAESPATHQIQPNNNELLTAETTTAVFTACAECTRLVEEELGITPKIIRPLWLNQAFFTEDVDNLHYHELCIYFLLDISETDLLSQGESFTANEGERVHSFEWMAFEHLQEAYFYPLFLKTEIFNLPKEFTIRTEIE